MCLSTKIQQYVQYRFALDPIHNPRVASIINPVNVPSIHTYQFSNNDPVGIPTEDPGRDPGVFPRVVPDKYPTKGPRNTPGFGYSIRDPIGFPRSIPSGDIN